MQRGCLQVRDSTVKNEELVPPGAWEYRKNEEMMLPDAREYRKYAQMMATKR